MLTSGPLLALVLPVLDISDLPPLQTPPMPVGASRIEIHSGWYVATDIGLEVEAGLVGAGYIVRFQDGTLARRGTLATRLASTWFTLQDSDMPQDRFWVGPFVRAECASELMGRYEGLSFGTVNRAAMDLGFRYSLGPATPGTGSIGIGYGLAHDKDGRSHEGIKHGLRLQLDFALR